MNIENTTLISVEEEDILDGVLTIPTYVTKLARMSLSNLNEVKEIRAVGVVEIEAQNFMSCKDLTTVILPNALNFGNNCFYACNELSSLNLPKAEFFGDHCLRGNKLSEISLPSAIQFGQNCFNGNDKLLSIDLPNVERFGRYALNYTGITELELPKLKHFGDNCFIYNLNLTSIKFDKKIGEFKLKNIYDCLFVDSLTVFSKQGEYNVYMTTKIVSMSHGLMRTKLFFIVERFSIYMYGSSIEEALQKLKVILVAFRLI